MAQDTLLRKHPVGLVGLRGEDVVNNLVLSIDLLAADKGASVENDAGE